MQFLGQQCKKCSHKNVGYADPEFEEDSIKFILERLYERIQWNYYDKARPLKDKTDKGRPNKIQGPHEKSLCEACRFGYCDRN